MKMLGLAWRNLLRNRRRSLATLVAMMLGMTAVLLFGGYVRDIKLQMQTDFVRLTGHLQVQHKDYYRLGSGNPAAYGIANYQRVVDTIRSDRELAPMLAVVTPTLQFGGIIGNFAAGVSRTAFITGAVAEEQAMLHTWNDYGLRILSTRQPLSGTARDSVVIGTGVARVLQLCSVLSVPDCGLPPTMPPTRNEGAALPDDIAALGATTAPSDASSQLTLPRIEILAANSRGAPNVAAVNVVRAEFQGIKELDDVYVGMHLAPAQRLVFGAAPPQVTAILIQLRQTAQIPVAQARLQQLLSNDLKNQPLATVDYEVLNPFYGQTLGMFAAIFGFMSVLIGAIVLFTVVNTMSMVVIERTTEVGTLRAIGLRRDRIRWMFVTEGVVLGAIGAILGILFALALASLINGIGMTWTPPGRVEPVPLSVRLSGEFGLMAVCAVGLLVVAGLSALIPASRAARLNIVEALRHV